MEKTELLRALKLCKPALGTPIIQGLDQNHFCDDRVVSFNGAIKITSNLTNSPVKGSIDGDTFYKLINRLPSNIELRLESDVLDVSAGRSKAKFVVMPTNEDLLTDMEETEVRYDLPHDAKFLNGLRHCSISIATNKHLGEAGIHVVIGDGYSSMYASNGTIYSMFRYPIESVANSNMFIPSVFADNLIIMADVFGTPPESIWATEKYIWAQFETGQLRCSFYANPVNTDLKTLIDSGIVEISLMPAPTDLLVALNRCDDMSSDDTVTLSYGDGRLHFLTKGQSSLFEDSLDFEYPTQGSFNISIKHVKKAYSSLLSPPQIGFGENHILLAGADGHSNHIITAKSV